MDNSSTTFDAIKAQVDTLLNGPNNMLFYWRKENVKNIAYSIIDTLQTRYSYFEYIRLSLSHNDGRLFIEPILSDNRQVAIEIMSNDQTEAHPNTIRAYFRLDNGLVNDEYIRHQDFEQRLYSFLL